MVLAVTHRGIAGASAGYSGAWLITRDGYEDLTHRQHPKPFLGSGAAVPVAFSARRFAGPLLLATDGLLKYTSPELICDVARGEDLDQAAKGLVDLVRLRSGGLQDDVAVILCRADGRG